MVPQLDQWQKKGFRVLVHLPPLGRHRQSITTVRSLHKVTARDVNQRVEDVANELLNRAGLLGGALCPVNGAHTAKKFPVVTAGVAHAVARSLRQLSSVQHVHEGGETLSQWTFTFAHTSAHVEEKGMSFPCLWTAQRVDRLSD